MPNQFTIQNATFTLLEDHRPSPAQEAPQPDYMWVRFGPLVRDAVKEAGGLMARIGLDTESGLIGAEPQTLQKLINENAEWLELSARGDFETKKTLVRTYAARIISCAIAAVAQADAEDTILHKD